MKKFLLSLAVLGLLVGSSVGISNDEVEANTVNGCSSQYYKTRFSTKCAPARAAATYQTKGYCRAQVDKWGSALYVRKGYYLNGISSGECRFQVTGAETYAW